MKHNLPNDLKNLRAAVSPSQSRDSTREAVCREWVQILEQYQAAVKSYGEATAELWGVPGAEFNTAWARAETSYQVSKRFRAALFEHEHKHGCSVAHVHSTSPKQG